MLTPPILRAQIASALSMKFTFVSRVIIRVRPSGIAPKGCTTKTRKLEINRGDAVALARALEIAGCGEFKVGRRGAPSRFVWSYSCIGLGKAAAGEPIALEQAENPQDDEEEETGSTPEVLTIAQAKAALARSSGISIDQIEIKINA
jgi:hypothetical protein